MSGRKNLTESYLLSLLGFVGFAGIHRFYLGKPVSGFLYLITGGFAGIGTIFDLFFMRRLVDEANHYRSIDDYRNNVYEAPPRPSFEQERPEAKSLEHLIFILAQENEGVLSAAQLALESGISAEQATNELDKMILKKQALPGQRENGLKIYVFQDFLSPEMRTKIIF